MRLHGRVLLYAILCAVASGCKSKAEQLADELDTSVSWAATLEAVARSWADNRVPSRYVERTIAEAREALTSAGQTRAASIAWTLDDIVRRQDRRAIAEPLRALQAERDALESRLEQVKRSR